MHRIIAFAGPGFTARSTEIGVEGANELSLEEKEKAAYNFATSHEMSRGASAREPVVDDVSALLRAWTDGDQHALARLTPIVYDELHRLAHYYLKRERAGHTLHTTALVNEAYIRLVDYKRMRWQNRAPFLAVSAQAMRRILVDHARRRNVKRGAGVEHVSLDAGAVLCTDRSDDFVSLDDALKALAERAPRKARVVELRFFGGLGVDETAEVLHVSSITVMREWKSARAWLYRELTGESGNGRRPLDPRR